MMSTVFASPEASHAHSRQTLETFYQFDDFMESIGTLADMGCGSGLDLEWWATRTTRDETPRPLNIRCTGIDQPPSLPMAHRYKNIQYQPQDFEQPIVIHKRRYDMIWCHDAFQYVIDPFATLRQWRDVTSDSGMLVLILPQTTNMEFNSQAFDQRDGCYWHWTMTNLIHVLAVSGWDCAGGFFRKNPEDPWLHAAVYKGTQAPLDPRTTRWYDLADQGLLPESAAASVRRHGYLRQRDLVLPWLDRSLQSFAKH
jgi:SAM-dependent methyltransferase